MRKFLLLSLLATSMCLLGSARAHAATCATLTSPSQSSLQSALNSCGSGNTLQLNTGSTTITSSLTIPCGVQITGPVANPATAQITTSTGGISIFVMSGGCASSNTSGFSYLHLNGAGAFHSDSNSYANISIQHNQVTGIPAQQSCGGPCQSIYFDGHSGTTVNNVTIQYNTLGDNTSCTAGVNIDDGGCAGILGATGNPMIISNLTVRYNIFNHLQEAIHFNPPFYKVGNPTSQCNNCDIEFNFFNQIHRIGIEFQISIATGALKIENNVFGNPLNSYYGSFALSIAGCQYGTVIGTLSSTVPSCIINNNVIAISSSGSSGSLIWGSESWGTGAQYNNNLWQGAVCTPLIWGYGTAPWSMSNNTMQGPVMSGKTQPCPISSNNFFPNGSFFENEFGQNNPPTMVGNVQGSTPASVVSVAPQISPTPSGTYSAPIAVTITDPGYTNTSIPVPQGNTAIYYTTDGSTPTTASPSCLSPCSINVNPGTTLNTIGMWGYPGVQPASYPAGYAFTPSPVVGVHYSAGSAPTLTGVALTLTGGGNSVQTGSTIQAIATCSYSGVSSTNCTTTDPYGTTAGAWGSSNTGAATISSSGLVQGVATGSANLTVHAGAFTSSPFALTVTNPQPVLTGVAISDGGVSTIAFNQTAQATATAQYTQSVTQNCSATPDQYGTTCGTWLSSNTGAATISSSGLISGVSAGSTNLTVKATAVGGANFTSSPLALTVTGTPPVATLTGVTITCANSSVQVGNTNGCAANCAYNIAPTTNCTTTDSHGTLASGWGSSSTGVATISSSGVATGVSAGTTSLTVSAGTFTSPSFPLTVTAPPATVFLGNSIYDTPGKTSANYINATYAVTGTNPGGYTVTNCSFYLAPGTFAAGSKWDCGLVLAPTPTTQASSWLCHTTYTTFGTSADVGWHTLAITGCGVLPVHTAYWVDTDTNETSPAQPAEGFSTCSGNPCTGSAPTIGNGTYPCRYISATYGVYTGMATAMNAGCGPGPTFQSSQYATLVTPLPTLTGGYLTSIGATTVIAVGESIPFFGNCTYSNGTGFPCWPTPDQYGNTVTSFTSSNPAIFTVGDIGSAQPGIATGKTLGVANVQATMTGGVVSNPWALTVSGTPLPYPPTKPRGVGR